MSTDISNMDNVIDSRDVVARIEELESLRNDWQETNELEEFPGYDESEEGTKWYEWEESEEGQELKILKALADEGEGSPDWSYGETLIRDSYFEDYAQQLAEDLGYMQSKEIHWPFTCI